MADLTLHRFLFGEIDERFPADDAVFVFFRSAFDTAAAAAVIHIFTFRLNMFPFGFLRTAE